MKNFIVLLCSLLCGVGALKWDSLVEEYFPKSCPRGYTLTSGRLHPSAISPTDVAASVRQAQRLLKAMDSKIMTLESEPFPSQAMGHFFATILTDEQKLASERSKATLLAARILQNKFANCKRVTPNTFLAFLLEHTLRATPPAPAVAGSPYTRIAPHNYADGIYSMPRARSGAPLPSARLISSRLFGGAPGLSRVLTVLASQWGQLITHDVTMRLLQQANDAPIHCCAFNGTRPLPPRLQHPACAPILTSSDDPFYSRHGVRCINFVRSLTTPNTRGTLGPAEQLNSATASIDGSPIYGTSPEQTGALRAFTGGRLTMSPTGLLPEVANVSAECDDTGMNNCPCYNTGDNRANQTPGLVALHTLLAREHNRVAGALQGLNPHWGDERLFREARRVVVAQIQHITYQEWLPLIIGKKYAHSYKISPRKLFSYDHNAGVNLGVINAFATAAFRQFHAIVPGDFLLYSASGEKERMSLSDHFMRPFVLEQYRDGLDCLLRGSLRQPSLNAGPSFSRELTNYLFRSQGSWGLDLAAIDIQRGRDHGLASYNTYRSLCGLNKAKHFDDLIGEISAERIASLKSLYEHVDDIDLFVGGILEKDVYGSLLGPTFQSIVGEQFYRTRVGDKNFYDNGDLPHSFTPAQLKELKKSSIARLICDNSDNIQDAQQKAFELTSRHNPMYSCDDIANIPFVNLKYWKE